MVLHANSLSTEELEAGGLPQVLDQAGLHSIRSARVIEWDKQTARQTNEKNYNHIFNDDFLFNLIDF